MAKRALDVGICASEGWRGVQEVQVEEDALSQQHKAPEQRPRLLQLQERQQVLHSTPQPLSSFCMPATYLPVTYLQELCDAVVRFQCGTAVRGWALKAGSRGVAQ